MSSTKNWPPHRRAACTTSDDGLRDRHEEARHLGMRDRYRPALLDLRRKIGITLPATRARCRSAPTRSRPVSSQREASTITRQTRFAAPMTLVGFDRLVGGDEDEALDARPRRRLLRSERVPSTLLRPPAADSPRSCRRACTPLREDDLAAGSARRPAASWRCPPASASTGIAAGKSRSSTSSRSISKSGDSPLSTSTSRAAPRRAS